MEKRIAVLLVVPFLLFWHWFEPAARKNQQGIESYDGKKFAEALKIFLSAKGIRPEETALKSNVGSTLYELKKFKEALEEFSRIEPGKLGVAAPDFHYNLGNAFFRLEQYDRALQSYKNSLLLRPEDIDAKKNYEWTLKKQEEQKKKDKPQQNQNQQNQPQAEPQQNHGAVMQFLNQKEKEQMEKKKRKGGGARNEKDW